MSRRLLLAIAVLLVPDPGRAEPCFAPASIGDGWPIAAPGNIGFDATALCAALAVVATGDANVHSVIAVRHGWLVAELYRTGLDRSIWSVTAHETASGPNDLHDLRSVSKSVVGLLVGIAVQDGRIASVDAPVLGFFPEYEDLRSPEREAITVAHLLTMSSGLDWNEELSSGLRGDDTGCAVIGGGGSPLLAQRRPQAAENPRPARPRAAA